MSSGNNQEYSGAALNSFVLALGHSDGVVHKLLAEAGVDRIDPEAWYDHDWAMSIFYKIEEQIGRAAVLQVGKKMIESAVSPPNIDGIHSLLMALGQAYSLNARGPCARYGVKPLIEHSAEGCKDKGAAGCIYHVSW